MRLRLFSSTLFLFLLVNYAQAKPQFGRALLFNENWKFIVSTTIENYTQQVQSALNIIHNY